MSNLRVNTIVNKADNGAVELTQGATIPAGQTIEGDLEINSSGIITSTSLQVRTIFSKLVPFPEHIITSIILVQNPLEHIY